jgi:hypothetical protein
VPRRASATSSVWSPSDVIERTDPAVHPQPSGEVHTARRDLGEAAAPAGRRPRRSPAGQHRAHRGPARQRARRPVHSGHRRRRGRGRGRGGRCGRRGRGGQCGRRGRGRGCRCGRASRRSAEDQRRAADRPHTSTMVGMIIGRRR